MLVENLHPKLARKNIGCPLKNQEEFTVVDPDAGAGEEEDEGGESDSDLLNDDESEV